MTPTMSARRTGSRRWALPAVAFLAFLVLLVLVAVRWGPLHRLDAGLDDHLNSALAHHPGQVTFWKGVTTAGQPITFELLSVLVGVLLWRSGRPRAALFVPGAVVGADVLSTIVKVLVDRARPVVADVLIHPAGASFPSGHAIASSAAAIVVVVLVRGAAWRALAVVAAVLVAASRLALGAHYLSDVVGSWLLATAWTLALALVLRPEPLSGPSPSTAA